MLSLYHEALLQLFRNRPKLAPELLDQALQHAVPEFTEARIESAELTDIQPAEYRADLVVLLLHGEPVLGIVVEIQLACDKLKNYSWPTYAINLRGRLHCPVILLVVAPEESVARWAAQPIDLGGGNHFTPKVIGPRSVPQIVDPEEAKADPELAVLSALSHGRSGNVDTAVQIALAAMAGSLDLDADRSVLYVDLIDQALSEAARKVLQAMKPESYEFQSEFAKRYVAQGRAEGKEEGIAEGKSAGKAEGLLQGKADLVVKLLTLKFGAVSAEIAKHVATASVDELDAMAGRVLSAATIEAVIDSER